MAASILTLPANLIRQPKLGLDEKTLLKLLSQLHHGELRVDFATAGSFLLRGEQAGPSGQITIHKPLSLLRALLWKGDLGFGESYVEGDWTSQGLTSLLYLLSMNREAYTHAVTGNRLARLWQRMRHAMNRNSLIGSRRNISAHYDLGNEFYQCWLDPGMTYSSAIFKHASDLESAQAYKYERLLNHLDPEPGEHILEIGCGWGGFAEYAARWGMRVTAVTLSQAQYDYARERIRKAGLEDRVELLLTDYRNLDGEYDHIVSIEMFEAVGKAYWPTYFDVLARCLKDGGRAALQVITIREDLFDEYERKAGGFIQRHIFPGGMLPTSSHLWEHAWDAGLEPVSLEAYGEDYADTLSEWHEAFNGQTDWMERHGYDRRFRRMWRYYLALCEAGFRDGRIDLVHFALGKH